MNASSGNKKRSLEDTDDEASEKLVAYAGSDFKCLMCDKNDHTTKECRTFKYVKENHLKNKDKKKSSSSSKYNNKSAPVYYTPTYTPIIV